MSSLMPTYRPLPVAFQRGEGAYLYDSQNRRYLDGVSGIAVTNLGHTHPAVTEAVCEQMHTLTHTSNLYRIAPQEMLGTLLTSATGMEQVFFCNSGAEGNEAAIKLARRYGHEYRHTPYYCARCGFPWAHDGCARGHRQPKDTASF